MPDTSPAPGNNAALAPCLIGSEWTRPARLATSPVHNPSTGAVITNVPLCGESEVDDAVQAATEAFPAWSETPAVERARLLFRYKMLLEDEFESLAIGLTREHGKTLAEARGDLRRGIETVEFACGAPSLLMGESLENIARGIDCDAVRQPLGVCAGITPFNFPAMIPLWMFPLAIVCGNTFLLKPSEKTPLTSIRLVELLLKAGLPPGVVNLVHGGREAVDAILEHPDIQAVSFVGSTPVASIIYQEGTTHGKRVQAAGGAKNYIVVMPDAADHFLDRATQALVEASFGCAGERCMSGSTAIAVGAAGEKLVPALAEAAKSMRVGPTDPELQAGEVHMGPVITREHQTRVESLIDAGSTASAGGKLAHDGRGLRIDSAPDGFYVGPTVVDHVAPDNRLMQEEVFGPVLSVMRTDDLEAAIAQANASSFGNGAAIFTRNGRTAREFRHRVQAGMVGINVGVPAPMAFFPFSGWNQSFFGDLHLQGKEAIAFYTKQKVITTRWFADGEGDVWAK